MLAKLENYQAVFSLALPHQKVCIVLIIRVRSSRLHLIDAYVHYTTFCLARYSLACLQGVNLRLSIHSIFGVVTTTLEQSAVLS